jgi:hypothetical protein
MKSYATSSPWVAEAMAVVVRLPARQPVRVVEAQQARHGHVVQRESVADAVRPGMGDRTQRHPEPDAPAMGEPVSPPMVTQQAIHRRADHISSSDNEYKPTMPQEG